MSRLSERKKQEKINMLLMLKKFVFRSILIPMTLTLSWLMQSVLLRLETKLRFLYAFVEEKWDTLSLVWM